MVTADSYRRAVDCVMRLEVAPHLAAGRPNLVVFDEDVGLETLAIGPRGASARSILRHGTASCENKPSPCQTLAALSALDSGYGRALHYLEGRFPGLSTQLGRAFVAGTDEFVRVFMATMSEAARRYHVYVVASNSQAPFALTSNRQAVAALRDPSTPGVTEVYAPTSSHVYVQAFLWGPLIVGRKAPRPVAFLLAVNRKVPLTSFEQALGFVPGPATGAAARRNLKPFRIPGTRARLGFATSLPAFVYGHARPGHDCADVSKTYMNCLDHLGANVLIQADANDGAWTGPDGSDGAEHWQPLSWMGSAWRAVSDPNVHFAYAVNPMMVGNLADTPFDGQSAILQRGLQDPLHCGTHGCGCHYIGNSSFVSGQDDPALRSYAGNKTQFLALAPWVVSHGSRPALAKIGTQLAAGTGASSLCADRADRRPPVPGRPHPERMHDRGARMTGISRRELVIGAGATAAGALLGDAESAAARRRLPGRAAKHVDVVVVGGGLAGLTTATDLAHAGHSVVLLEARDRVGGRTLNHSVGDGEVVEVGGQWVGPGQDRILARAKALDIRTFKTYTKGEQILDYRGKKSHFTGLIPPLPEPDAGDFGKLLGKIVKLQGTVPRDEPWTAHDARSLDSQTADTFKLANSSTYGARFLYDLAIKAVFAADPRDLSLLHMLFYLHSGNGIINLTSTAGGAQDSRFHGGSQLVSLRMAKRLGARVVLSAPVRRITQSGGGVIVESDAGSWHAKRVVVAMAPMLAGRIDFQPEMPALRDGLTQHVPQGSVIKYEAVYPSPFWRDRGLSGYANSDRPPIRLTYDNSPPSGKPGVLLGFVVGEDARRLQTRSAKARRHTVLETFTRLFGARAGRPRELIEHNWSAEAWTRGCYAGYMPPGVWSDYGQALRAPVGRIHWAGTETSEVFMGYMDGAVRSGERAAREVGREL